MARGEILLESGTNELEIAEFFLGGQSYGINVAKVREIVLYKSDAVTKIVGSSEFVMGSIIFRGHSIPLINLPSFLNITVSAKNSNIRQVVIVTEYNNTIRAFLVDGVSRIHRISWNQFIPIHPILGAHSSFVGGSFHIEKREILILDFESIAANIFNEQRLYDASAENLSSLRISKRADIKILMAEDSRTIQDLLRLKLKGAGITEVFSFDDGKKALEKIEKMVEECDSSGTLLKEKLHIVITDIEMPVMDGLTLCKAIRNNPKTSYLPVIVFSSMISEDMTKKCKQVGASECISKPQIDSLITVIDDLCLNKN
ncbi:MAG: chemotaxis protein CheV [Candidatus Riflebacteria bacterium]|nr:chemotaxis protein CheV [Candidatus Riflebacteria bacterium]